MAAGGPRVGLVLGAGGVAGGAFHAGVLAALEAATRWDPRRATVVVGTSAGSVTGAALRAGLPAGDLLARAEGRALSAEGAAVMARVGPPLPPPPLRPAVQPRPPAELAATLLRAVARPLSARPWALIAGLLPEGSVGTEAIAAAIGALFPAAWPAAPLWVCAVRQADGRRVVFGRDDQTASLPEAVAASCAIPGVFTPVTIGGAGFIDGGVHSPTNLDVLADGPPFDLVLVSSPMSVAGRRIRLAADQPVRRWSRALLDAEALRVRRRGGHVVAFQPTAEDLAVIGLNAMDPSRRAAIAGQAFRSTLRRLERADTRARLAVLAR